MINTGNNKLILVTGAAGFIGAASSELLLKQSEQVIGIDNLNDYYDKNLKKYRLDYLRNYTNFKFHEIDIENLDRIEEVFSKYPIQAVINLAARAGVRASIENPYVYATTNIIGTINLLEMCHKYNVGKFVLASSSSLYAGEQTPFNELMQVDRPISQYAATKNSAELMAYTYHHLYDIDVSVLRFFTVFGPAGRPDMSYFKFIRNIDLGHAITIYGDGTQRRDFTYIDDIASGVVLSLDKLGYEIINLGGGKKPITIIEMIELIERHLGKKANIIFEDFHSADMSETGADISKAQKLLNWQPEIDFHAGIAKTVDWYKNNKQMIDELDF